MFQKVSGIKKIHGQKGGGVGREYHIYLPKIFCLTVPTKYRRGTLYCVTKFRCRKSSCLIGFCLVFFCRKIFVSQCTKYS